VAKKATEAVESRGRRLILGAADDLAAEVADDPDMIELDVAQPRLSLDHVGETTEGLKWNLMLSRCASEVGRDAASRRTSPL
jgi:hypothetical protein